MSAKRKTYTIKEKLGIIDRVKRGDSKSSLFREFGVPEGTIRGWMKEEDKLRSFVDQVDDEIGLDRKKARLSAAGDVDECLFTWFVQKRSEGVPLSGPLLQAQAIKLNKQIGGAHDFVASAGWLSRWKIRHGVAQVNMQGESRSSDSEAAREFCGTLRKMIDEGEYTEEQLYNCDETALYYRLLPTKSLDIKKSANKSGIKMSKERVTLLLCANKSGSHKLKPLCIGKNRSPRCFKHVNMTALPINYKNSQNAWMTRDIFLSWFNEDFVPSVKSHLRSKKLEEKALLLLDNCPAHPSSELLISRDGKIVASFLPKNTTALIQPMDQGIIRAFKAHYRRELLTSVINSELQVQEYLKTVTLKNMAYNIGLAWKKITSATILNCWSKCEYTAGDSMEDEDEFLGFTEEDAREASDVLSNKLFVSDLEAWVREDEETPVSAYKSDEEIVAAVQSRAKTAASSEDESENEEDECEVEMPKTGHLLHNISELMNWLEGQSDCDSIHLLHLQSIKNYVTKKRHQLSRQKKISEYFSNSR